MDISLGEFDARVWTQPEYRRRADQPGCFPAVHVGATVRRAVQPRELSAEDFPAVDGPVRLRSESRPYPDAQHGDEQERRDQRAENQTAPVDHQSFQLNPSTTLAQCPARERPLVSDCIEPSDGRQGDFIRQATDKPLGPGHALENPTAYLAGYQIPVIMMAV